MDQYDEIRESDIAIVGMACRLPGAPSVDAFWRNLREGVESTTFLSDEELLAAGVDQRLLDDPSYVKAAQLLPDADQFDAGLFRITSDEAEILDPQHRQFLECSLAALEDAGYDPGAYDGSIGVYGGAGMNTYLLHNLHDRYREASALDDYRLMLANDKDFLTTRVSYKLDLRGPSLSVNTACSTSLVAVHTACLSLISGDCDVALAGAVHIKVPQRQGYRYQEGMILSPDGHCRAFDAKAQGTIVGDGVGRSSSSRCATPSPTATSSTRSSRAPPSTTTVRRRPVTPLRPSRARRPSSATPSRSPTARRTPSATSRRTVRAPRSATPSKWPRSTRCSPRTPSTPRAPRAPGAARSAR